MRRAGPAAARSLLGAHFLLLGVTVAAQERPAHVFGRVVDESDEPVADVEVTLWRTLDEGLPVLLKQHRPMGSAVVRAAKTDRYGRFRLQLPRTGTHYLTAAGPGGVSGPLGPVFADDVPTLVLQPAVRLRGRVVRRAAGEDTPAAGVEVRVSALDLTRHQQFGELGRTLATLITDAAGEFAVAAPPRRALNVAANHGAEHTAQRLAAATEERLDLVLSTDQFVTGRVVDGKSGAAIAGAEVQWYGVAEAATVVTGADGSFSIPVTDRAVILQVVANARPPAAVILDKRRGFEKPIEVAVEPPSATAWRLLRADGTPWANTPVLVHTVSQGGLMITVVVKAATDAAGRVALPVGPGLGDEAWIDTGGVWSRVELPALGGEEARDLTVRTAARLRGRVVDPDGAPAAGARVYVQPADRPRGGLQLAYTDHAGRFEFRGLAPAAYRVAVFSADAATTIATCRAAPDSELLRLSLTRVAGIRGRVLAADGTPAEGVTVRVHPRFYNLLEPPEGLVERVLFSVTTDEDGRFVAPVPEGSVYTVMARRVTPAGSSHGTLDVVHSGADVEVRLK